MNHHEEAINLAHTGTGVRKDDVSEPQFCAGAYLVLEDSSGGSLEDPLGGSLGVQVTMSPQLVYMVQR